MSAVHDSADWRSRGACITADPDLFFPISAAGAGLTQEQRAKQVCTPCQVRQQCLDYALKNSPVQGVWGGSSEHDRQLMLQHQRPSATAGRRHPAPAPAGQH